MLIIKISKERARDDSVDIVTYSEKINHIENQQMVIAIIVRLY